VTKSKFLLRFIFFVLITINLFYFILIYSFHYPIQRAEDFQYGFEQMASYIRLHYSEYEKIIVDPRFGNKDFYFYGVPHVYIPYYTNLDPRKLQSSNKVLNGIAFDKYEFRYIDWSTEKYDNRYLYIVPQDNIPTEKLNNINEIGQIQLPNHKVQFRFYSLKQ
jgi:hypothetical protein